MKSVSLYFGSFNDGDTRLCRTVFKLVTASVVTTFRGDFGKSILSNILGCGRVGDGLLICGRD